MMKSLIATAIILFVALSCGVGFSFAQDQSSPACSTVSAASCDSSPALPAAQKSLPPEYPRITFKDGHLTVTAANATLRDILLAVSAKIGATVALPAAGLDERVFVHIGPGPTRDVLSELLNGSSISYVLVESPKQPGVLQSIVLINTGQDAETAPPAAPRIATPPPVVAEQPPDESDDPVAAAVATATPVDPSVLANSGLQPPKEPLPPEVLKQMMHQRMEQRRLQNQQQQPAAQPPPEQ